MRLNVQSFAAALLLLGSSGLLVSCASANGDSEVGKVQARISGGEPDSQDSNVFLLVSHRGSAGAALCSGSLIAPNLLLTARHCVSDVSADQVMCGQTTASAPLAVNTLYAANAPSLADITAAYSVSAVSVPSDSSDLCGHDVALVTLATVVPSSVATPLVPNVETAAVAGQVYDAVGYGLDSPSEAGVAGARRVRAGLKVVCKPGNCGEGVEPSEFVGGPGVCSGDSGGPALDAAGQVIGVASRGGSDCTHPIYSSVASWKDWLVSVANQAAAQGHYAVPDWAKTDDAGDSTPDAGDSKPDAGSAVATSGGTQGDKCVGPAGCQATFACFSPTGLPADGYCAALCKEQAECASGTSCVARVGVCVANARANPSSSSCSLSAAGRDGGTANAALFALFAVALGFRKRASQSKRVSEQ